MVNLTNKEERTLNQIQNSIEKLNDIQDRIYELDDLDGLTNQQAQEVDLLMFKNEKEALNEIRHIVDKAEVYEKYETEDRKQISEYYTKVDIQGNYL